MTTLAQIYERYKGAASHSDKGTIHSYIQVYEELLTTYRHTALNVLEIGILNGDSLRMWEEYFDTSTVYGADLNDHPLNMADLRPMIAEGTHHIKLLDAADPAQVEQHFGGTLFDVVIEDASHILSVSLAIYANFRHRLRPGGLYVIEDIENLDRDRTVLQALDPTRCVTILDRRSVKQRFDDVLVVINEVTTQVFPETGR